MLRLVLALIALACVSGANYKFMETSACEKVASESSCISTSGCSWCESGAVGASCMDASDAAALPSSVFTCTDASLEEQCLGPGADCSADLADPYKCCAGFSCERTNATSTFFATACVEDTESLTSSRSGYKGFDITQQSTNGGYNGPLTPSAASCLASSEYSSFIVARGYRNGGSADTKGVMDFCPTLENAKTAGIPDRHVYMSPDSLGSKSATTQMGELKAALDGCSAFNGKVWLDIENSSEWSESRYTNRDWYTELVDACTSSGYSCGIYSAQQDWYAIFEYAGDPFSYGSDLPLWYNNFKSGDNRDPDFLDYPANAFGGWKSPSAKKFNALYVCGIENLLVDYALDSM